MGLFAIVDGIGPLALRLRADGPQPAPDLLETGAVAQLRRVQGDAQDDG